MNLESPFLRVILDKNNGRLNHIVEVKIRRWRTILRSVNEKSQKPPFRSKNPENYTFSFDKRGDNLMKFKTTNDNFKTEYEVKIVSPNILHFNKILTPKNKLKLSELLIEYKIELDDPEYTWVPHLKLNSKHIIPDHVFRSPVIIYRAKDITFALIPDLTEIERNYNLPMILDFNIDPKNKYKFTTMSYGFCNYKPSKHVFFRKSRKKLKIKKDAKLVLSYYIKIYKNREVDWILKEITSFLWEKFGHKYLEKGFEPQVLPYDLDVKEGFQAIFDRHKYWGEFYLNGKKCGGTWQRTWLGEKKKPLSFIKPEDVSDFHESRKKEIAGTNSFLGKIINWISFSPKTIKFFDKFTRHNAIVNRTAEVWNNAWFLNIRTAYGFYYFGELWDDVNLIKKSSMILETILNLPRKKGLFPSVILPGEENATQVSYINGVKAFLYSESFHIPDNCLAMYWALKFHQDLKKDERIPKKSMELFQFLRDNQIENGEIPTYVNVKRSMNIQIAADLLGSASSSAALMFLTELYKIDEDKSIIEVAEGIATFLIREIFPVNKWHDFEPFYSCTNLPITFYDKYTDNHVINTLSIYWTAEGFKELFKITKNQKYLEFGELALSILSLFQQIWNMPNLSYNTFGGFGVQNADAELNDARQGLFVRTYAEYYLLTGSREYMERAIAALRACWTLQLHPAYKDVSPGNLDGIETLNSIDKGCVAENYGHAGIDFRVTGYIMFDWGVGTAAMATAYMKKKFGDLYIDFKESMLWGIDGIIVRSFNFKEKTVEINAKIIHKKRYVLLKAREIDKEVSIKLNNNKLDHLSPGELKKGIKIDF